MRQEFLPTEQPANVGEINDDAMAGLLEVRGGGLAAKKRRLQISVERSVPTLFGSFAKLRLQKIGGAIDKNVKPPEVRSRVGK